jgi:hypothetical protein
MARVEPSMCFHCQSHLTGSRFDVSLHSATDDVALPLCEVCQGLRQAGQLPVELLVQQWLYGVGRREDAGDPFRLVYVSLACLGCGTLMGPRATVREGVVEAEFPVSRRLPDGSIAVPCATCGRTNVLEGRGAQLVAVRLW